MFNVTEGWDWLHDMRLNFESLKMIVKRASYFRVQWSSLKSYLTMLAAKNIPRFIYPCWATCWLPVSYHVSSIPSPKCSKRTSWDNRAKDMLRGAVLQTQPVMLQSWGGYAMPDTWGASFNLLLCTCSARCFVLQTPELWLAIACTLIL